MHIPLRTVDLVIVVLYLLGITWFGLRFRNKGERSIKSYFLADRNIPWWAISLSIVAAETSTLTIISVPGIAFTGDFGFLQLVMGYLLGRIVICILFLPRYFRGELMTAYPLIGQRFGSRLHRLTALLFLIMRAAAEGVRVFAVAIVVGVVQGLVAYSVLAERKISAWIQDRVGPNRTAPPFATFGAWQQREDAAEGGSVRSRSRFLRS